ncbi:hypothetical protein ACFVFS_33760 [Kitasatospora sp. NPDC057692]|uniref:hypothetical protein n=1 Tax=Kitasatospora sp. NPDC057692 TaxID=3346215 RepID=UPI00369EFDE0
MRRLAVVAAGVLAGAVAVTGCGSVRSTGGGGTAASAPSPSVSAAPTGYTEAVRKGVAEHDRLFPGVAALGCASVRPDPTAAGTGTGPADPVDPWAARHAENSMYKQMAPLDAADRCRGEAHRKRIADAVGPRAAAAPLTQDEVLGILASLGYPAGSVQFQPAGGELSFEVSVPGTGPCVAGRLGRSVTVEAHGPYLDGGCTEPKGGH